MLTEIGKGVNPSAEKLRLLKKGYLQRCPHPSSLRRTAKYASRLRTSGALHLALFEQPAKDHFPITLIVISDACIRRHLRL